MSRRHLLFLIAGLCTASGAATVAAPTSNVVSALAVMELSGEGVDKSASRIVTDALSDALVKAGNARVMERSQMESILKEQGFQQSGACDGSECAVEIGKLLSIDKIVVGSIGKLGGSYSLVVRLVDVRTGEVLGSVRRIQRGEIDQVVVDVLPGIARELVSHLAGSKGDIVAAAVDERKPLPASHGLQTMISVPSGCFEMGSPDEEGSSNEHPLHRVCVGAFSMDATEVTQAAYQELTGKNPSFFVSTSLSETNRCIGECPVEQVNWYEASDYCHRAGKRLPTEAEWEYAARAGTTTRWYWGGTSLVAREYAWFGDNSEEHTHPVGQLLPNPWGIYDMFGNVWEWTADWIGEYSSENQRDPKGKPNGSEKVLRGGGWRNGPTSLRSASRMSLPPDIRNFNLGFRCAAQ